MARKSNETLLRERLAKISACPFDIFEFLAPTDELFDSISLAECGDVNSISKLTSNLGKSCIEEKKSNKALVYLCELGLRLEIIDVALTLISYSLAVSECFSLALSALEVINGKAPDKIKASLCGSEDELRAKKLVNDISNACDVATLEADAALLPKEIFIAEHVYFISYKLKNHLCEPGYADELLKHAGLEQISSLPSFTGKEFLKDKATLIDAPEFFARLAAIQDRHTDSDWRDYWLRIMYECANYYLGGKYTAIAKHAINRALERNSVKNKNAHALAWTHYLLFSDNAVLCAEERNKLQLQYVELADSCKFEGIFPKNESTEEIESLMYEAIYISEKQAINNSIYLDSLGGIIRHENNRFLIEHELVGHSKRGHKHTWEFKMSMPREHVGEKLPKFQDFKVEKASPYATRGGVSLKREKTSSQIICRSEIKFGEVAHPFLIDFILDVNYISSVKCTLGELKIRSTSQDDKYITYACQLLLS